MLANSSIVFEMLGAELREFFSGAKGPRHEQAALIQTILFVWVVH